MAISIDDRAYFDAVVEFAKQRGQLDDLCAKLDWLDAYGGRSRSQCVMSPAPEPMAFELVMFQKAGAVWRPAFLGRLVYYTPDSRDANTTPRFAVTITATRDASKVASC
jgi:hypothetical protein